MPVLLTSRGGMERMASGALAGGAWLSTAAAERNPIQNFDPLPIPP
jgi:hypothetical protein